MPGELSLAVVALANPVEDLVVQPETVQLDRYDGKPVLVQLVARIGGGGGACPRVRG